MKDKVSFIWVSCSRFSSHNQQARHVLHYEPCPITFDNKTKTRRYLEIFSYNAKFFGLKIQSKSSMADDDAIVKSENKTVIEEWVFSYHIKA